MKRTGTGKHILVDGKWVRAPEVELQARNVEYEKAGVKGLYLDGSADDLRAKGVFASKRIKFPRGTGTSLWIHGGEMSQKREASVSYLLRCYVDAGQSAKRYRLTDLVDRWLDPDKAELRALKRELTDLDCVVLELSNEANHKFAPQVALEVMTARRGLNGLTVFVSSDDVASQPARYGPEVSAAMKGIKGTNRYLEVKNGK